MEKHETEYKNPIIFRDYPDVDIIRVGHLFYMVTSSFQKMPGLPICESKDLVHWKIIGHAFEKLDIAEHYFLRNGQQAYRLGVWAPCIRYNVHTKKFLISANSLKEGYMVFTADKAEGPYDRTLLGDFCYDPGMLIDDDGSIYVYYGNDTLYMRELSEDGKRFIGEAKCIYQAKYRMCMEGTHVYKRNGWYYLSCTAGGGRGEQIILRGKNPNGPFEAKVVWDEPSNMTENHYHQGGFVDLPDGSDMAFLFQDREYVGRCPVLLPMYWNDDWPVLGDVGKYERSTVCGSVPLESHPEYKMQDSDEFENEVLGLQWSFNHIPEDSCWSLTERKGYFRIHALKAESLYWARNTLTQKIAGPSCAGTVCLDGKGLKEGGFAGLCITNFYRPYGEIGIRRLNGKAYIVMQENGKVIEETVCREERVYLRIAVNQNGMADFYYSYDEKQFVRIGRRIGLYFVLETFLGNVFGLFHYNQLGDEGYADFDYFHMEAGSHQSFHRGQKIEGWFYDEKHDMKTEPNPSVPCGEFMVSGGNGAHLFFRNIDFGDGATEVELMMDGEKAVELYLDSLDTEPLGSVELSFSRGHMTPFVMKFGEVRGKHSLFIRFAEKGQRLSWFRLQ